MFLCQWGGLAESKHSGSLSLNCLCAEVLSELFYEILLQQLNLKLEYIH